MRVEKFVVTKKQKLCEAICENYNFINYNTANKIIRNKDVKVNGTRVNSDVVVDIGCNIEFYHDSKLGSIDIVYQDVNLIIVNKPRQIETCAQNNQGTLQSKLEEQIGESVYAVHRLDRNTSGLVVFAKNFTAKNELDEAIKNKSLQKYYIAVVKGDVKPSNAKCLAYLKKDAKTSTVTISKIKVQGFIPIQTDYKVLAKNENKSKSLLEVHLITGKTHQIRAHMAFLGHPVVGDEKYGDHEFNKQNKLKYQQLCAYKLIFNFKSTSPLYYLNNKVFELENEKSHFLKNL